MAHQREELPKEEEEPQEEALQEEAPQVEEHQEEEPLVEDLPEEDSHPYSRPRQHNQYHNKRDRDMNLYAVQKSKGSEETVPTPRNS